MARGKRDDSERIVLTKEERGEMIASLQRYFEREREEQMGNLAAEILLRHILRELGPFLYNAGVRDCARFMQQRIEDIGEIEMLPPFER